MEKQRKFRKFKFISGLLSLFCLGLPFICVEPVFAQQRLTYNIIKELTVKPVNQLNFSATDCAFELKIPYTKSDSVQAQIPDLPSGITFVSLRRSEYSDEDKESGTKIELWLNFADAKTYRLRALHVYINSKLYYIPFEPVLITENPRNILPQLLVTFENGEELVSARRGKKVEIANYTATAGKAVHFTVSLQYAVQIISYKWAVPKNALLREIQQYDITKGTLRSSDFSEEKIPVATFEWEPLYAGNLTLPEVKIIATSYNGTRIELNLPETLIRVQEGDKIVAKDNKDSESYFGYAFESSSSQVTPAEKIEISEEDCQLIAELRTLERHSIPFTKNYQNRKNAEAKAGISGAAIEPVYIFLWLSLALMVIFIILDAVAILTGKISGILGFSGLVVVAFVGLIIFSVQLSRTYAIFKGGSISPVPEESASAVASIESGKRVLIEQKAGNWVFVRYGSSGGWVTDDKLFFIDE